MVGWKKDRSVPCDDVLGFDFVVDSGSGGIGRSLVFCLDGGGGGEAEARGPVRVGEVGTVLVMDPRRGSELRLGDFVGDEREGVAGREDGVGVMSRRDEESEVDADVVARREAVMVGGCRDEHASNKREGDDGGSVSDEGGVRMSNELIRTKQRPECQLDLKGKGPRAHSSPPSARLVRSLLDRVHVAMTRIQGLKSILYTHPHDETPSNGLDDGYGGRDGLTSTRRASPSCAQSSHAHTYGPA